EAAGFRDAAFALRALSRRDDLTCAGRFREKPLQHRFRLEIARGKRVYTRTAVPPASQTAVDPNRLLAVVAAVAREARPHVEPREYHVERQPDRLSVFLYEEQRETPITYRALWDGALGYAARLAAAGLQPGQTVAIMLPTSKEYLYSFYGVLIAGGVPVPLYP